MKTYKDLTPEQIERRREAKRRYALRNAESEKIRKAKYQRTERAAEIKRRWKAENPEKVKESDAKYRLNCGDKIVKSSSEWRKRNPHKVNAKTAKYRAGKMKATPTWAGTADIDVIYQLARDLTDVSGVYHHVDHIVPLRSELVCGLHCKENLRVITRKENARKHNRFWPGMP